MITPLRKDTFKKLQLNAGLFVRDFDYTEYEDAAALKAALKALISGNDEKLLGATRGGGTFTVDKSMRSVEADGKRNEFVGSYIMDSVDAHMSGTLLEFTAKNIALAMGAADVEDGEGKVHTIKMRNDLEEGDYMEKLCWIGDMADGGMILISFDNALNTNNFEFTFTDKGEGTLPFELHAFQGDVLNDEYAPFAVVLMDA